MSRARLNSPQVTRHPSHGAARASAPAARDYRILDHRGLPAVTAPSSSPARRAYTGSSYTGANFSFARSWLAAYVRDAYADLDNWSLTELTRKSRWLKKNMGMIRGVAKAVVNHAIGPGLYIIPATASDDWNEAMWNFFWTIADSRGTDVANRLTLWDKQRLGTDHKFWDPDCFTLLLRNSTTGYPQYQFFRSHTCGNFDVDTEEGWINGVKVNSVLGATAYRFKLRGTDRYLTVPAKSVIHNYRLEDADGVRGVPATTHCINDLHDIIDSLALTKQTIKEIARRGVVIKTESGEAEDESDGNHFNTPTLRQGDNTDNLEDDPLPQEAVFSGGEIRRLKIGEELQVVSDNRPSPAFTGFIDFLGRGITDGGEVPYEFSWNRGNLRGPAQRMLLEQAKAGFAAWRGSEYRDSYAFYTFAVSCAVDLGIVPPRADQFEAEALSGAPDVSIDKGYDATANINYLKAGLETFKRYWAAQGYWWKKMLTQKADEAAFILKLAEQRKISPDWIYQLTANSGGKDAAAPATTAEPAEPAEQ
jgi:capsid protein